MASTIRPAEVLLRAVLGGRGRADQTEGSQEAAKT